MSEADDDPDTLLTAAQIAELPDTALRTVCKKFGLKQSGSRRFMVARLTEIVEAIHHHRNGGSAREAVSESRDALPASVQDTENEEFLPPPCSVVNDADAAVLASMLETLVNEPDFGVTAFGELDFETKMLLLEPIDPEKLHEAFLTSDLQVTRAQVLQFMQQHGIAKKNQNKPRSFRHYR
ncbi:hypothetical protein DIPPA_21045 [Diplonema papillatum]|nr:hypothetical protein DIPPA_21045 [Diplonema papillatum]